MRKIYNVWLVVLFFVVSGLVIAGTINVPANYPTIQQAINASVSGDTVLVAPGTYYENINFRGKNIVVTSWYALNQNTMYIDSTIINGSQPTYPDTASCVLIVSGENENAVLQGFTLTGGKGTVWKDEHNGLSYREGGGILTALSSPVIRNNVIKNNDASNDTGVSSCGGGGIRSGDGNPKILNNIIMYNRGRYGGGIVLNYTGAVVKNNVVYRNSGGEDFGGAGIWVNSNGPAPKVAENNTVVENSSVLDGGGFYVVSTSITLRNNIVWGNTAPVDPQITFASALLSVSYCDIQGGWSGTGNINVNPAFADTSHYLAQGSPCIDAGDPNASYYDPEDGTNPGFALHPSRGILRNDIGAYGGPGALPAPYVDLHLNDPYPPSNLQAYSDYQTPNSIRLSWIDPIQTNDTLPLSNFKLDIYRDGNFLAEVDSGVQEYIDNGLALHQLYVYSLNTVVPGDSSVFATAGAYAGGAAEPKPVSLFSIQDDTNGAHLYWKNPSQQVDGTPLNDLAYVIIYRDGVLLDSISQSVADTGEQRTYFDAVAGYHEYRLQVRDNESPVNYSVFSEQLLGYGGLLNEYFEDFENGFGSIYRTGTWDTTQHIARSGIASFTDSPDGNFELGATTYFLLPPIILGNDPMLAYSDIAILPAGNLAYTEISTNTRKSFSVLKVTNATLQPQWQDGTADPSDWVREFVDLKAYAGDTVTFRFRMFTGSGIASDGWYLDSIAIWDAGKEVNDTLRVDAGWNMVSLPLRVSDRSVHGVFPTAKSSAFSYNKGYILNDSLEPGNGYFVNFDSAETFNLTGPLNWRDTIVVKAGWNIVGCIGVPFDSSAIVTVPSGIIQTTFFAYGESGYTSENALLPGKSYWVKVSANGKLIMKVSQ